MSKRRRWILLPLAALAAILIVVVVLFDWNWLKGPIESAASAALGRDVEIAGELDVDLSMTPTVTLEQVRIANAEWGSRPHMLIVPQVAFAVDLSQLLRGEIELPFLRVQEPDLLLETNRQGQVNWQFGPPDQPPGAPPIPIIEDLAIANAAIRYHEPGRPQDPVAALETVDGAVTSSGVRLMADGTLNEEPLSLRLASAPVGQLEPETEAERFPFEFEARLGSTRLAATGSAEQPLQAQGLSVEIVVESEEPGTLLALAGREPRDLGALELSLALTRHDQIWALHDIDARLGESDLSGDASFSNQGEEPAIAAALHSNEVRLAEVRDLIGVLTDDPGPTPRQPTLEATVADAQAALESEAKDRGPRPDSALGPSPAMLPAVDAEVSYTIERLSGRDLLLRDLDFYGRLRDRLPYIALGGEGHYQDEPVTLAVRVGDATADSDTYPIRAHLAAAGTTVEAEGALTRPEELADLELRFDVASRNVGPLLALAEIDAPPIPPFEAHGRLAQDGAAWQLTDLDGRLGESDIGGRATVDLGQSEPLITAQLASDRVRLEDVRPLLSGADAQASETDPEAALDAAIAEAKAAMADGKRGASGPGFGLRRDMLPEIDAEVRYAIERLSGPEVALADLDLYARLEDGLPRLELTGGGQYRDMPVALDVQLGRTEQAAPGDGAYPIRARIEAAGTEIHLDGQIDRPETLDGLNLQVQVESENINELLALADLDLPQIPQFAISGHVVQEGQLWRIGDFYGQFSESELAGEVMADLSEQRPFITADLQSKRLLLSDLISTGEKPAVVEVAAAAANAEEMEAEQAALISLEGVNFDALPDLDADVSFAGEFVEVQEFRFDQLSFDLRLRDRVAVLDASGEGQYRDDPLSLEAHLGNKETLENPDARYPIDVQIASEDTRVTVEGTAARAGRSEGLQVDVALSGPTLDRVGEIVQLPLPTTPPFELHSHLARDQNRWILTDLSGTVGDSDVRGHASLVLGGERPMLEAELTSDALDFDDLGLLVGAPADPDETVSEEQKRAAAEAAAQETLLPDEPFDVPELRAVDARVSYQAKQVQAQKLPLQGMTLDLTLEDGKLTFEPLRFELSDGKLDSTIRLDGRSDILAGDIELDVRNIRLNQLLARFDIEIAQIEMEQEGVGAFSGRGKLAVRGNSIKQLAGSAEGQAAFIMRGGQLNALILEGVGLDIGEAVALLLTGDEEAQSEMVPIRCFVGDFEVQEGIMRAEALVLDTADSTITGKGQIDLGAETLSLEFVAHPKDASVLTGSTPVRIEGTFKEPEIDLVSQELQEKALAALGLGVILPVVGAVLPFIETGETEDKNCGGLIEAAAASVEKASPEPQSD
jgi:uncharacterized protein involved in outer membrane biogenesis